MKRSIRSMKSAFLTAILALSYSCSFGANVMFDLGDVLFETNSLRAFWESGINVTLLHTFQEMRHSQHVNPYSTNVLWAAYKTVKKQKIKERLYAFLELAERRFETTPLAKDADGNIIPQIMCSWLAGAYTTKEIRKIVKKTAQEHAEFFSTEAEKNRIIALCNRVMFRPETLAKTMKLISQGFEFAKECKQKGHKLYVLSNWDKESFVFLKQMYPELFCLFDGIMISGEAETLKPDPALYKMALEKFGIDARDTIFIDDVADNVVAARKCGIAAIHVHKKKYSFFSSPNFNNIKQEFNTWQRLHGFLSVA